MYAALLTRRIGRSVRRSLWHIAVMRSGLLTMIVVTAALLGLAFGWRAHRQGRFAQLKSGVEASKPLVTACLYWCVREARMRWCCNALSSQGQDAPEFLTATVLPGRGMNVLQITAYIPQQGRGAVAGFAALWTKPES